MRLIKSTSALEQRFAKALWRKGERGYRLHSTIPGRPDLVFPSIRTAVFVHGCFWHCCSRCNRRMPQANAEYWVSKLMRNAERDQQVTAVLAQMGWRTLIVWEHDLRRDFSRTIDRSVDVIRRIRATKPNGATQRDRGVNSMLSDRSGAEPNQEQDDAAGGRESRFVHVPDAAKALASVRLVVTARGRTYAYLRYKTRGENVTRYLGRITSEGRSAQLREGWELAQRKGLTGLSASDQ